MNKFVRHAVAACVAVGASLAAGRAARAQDDHALVEKGVAFLCAHQNEDGSYGPPAPGKKSGEIGITALVVKGLHEAKVADKDLAAKRDAVVEKGVAFLLGQQKDDGSFTDEKSFLATYRTGTTVLALVSIDKAKHAAAIDKAKKWLAMAQFDTEEKIDDKNPHFGGWGYDHSGTKPDADLSNTQIAVAALAEAGVGKDDPVMQRALSFVSRCQNDTESNKGNPAIKLVPRNDGGFFYGPTRATAAQTEIKNEDGTVSYESYASMTYAGLVSLSYAGLSKDDLRFKAARNWIKQHYTLDENYGLGIRAKDPKQAQMGLFYYYFTFARALHLVGEDEVETKDGKRKWGRDLLDALKARQKPDGSWSNEADRWMEGLPVLGTAYALNAANLALQHVGK